MDLLTVLEHELGHLLGHDHAADGLMAETLTAGTRSTPDGSTLSDKIFAADWYSPFGPLDVPSPKQTK